MWLAIAPIAIGFASEKKDLSDRYKGKYLVALQDGLAVGICTQPQQVAGLAILAVRVSADSAEFHTQTGLSAVGCGTIAPEALHKGEILRVDHTYFRPGGRFTIQVENVSVHEIERGQRVLEHRSFERGRADLIFMADDPKDYNSTASLVEKWVKVFDSQDEAVKFGNTANGAFVKEVKLGMTAAEVEAALGLPETKVDLGEKVLYKYKNMTVEFHDGKVTDVR